MRNRNQKNGIEVTAVAGTYVALLSILITDNTNLDNQDFLGFEIKRDDLTENESYPLKGLKYFAVSAKKLAPGQLFDSDKHPIQSFFWEDFTVKPEHEYIYHIIPVSGKPLNLKYGNECEVSIKSEKSDGDFHSVYFNRGVAGSLAYAREFDNKRPDKMSEQERKLALQWLSRGLEEALLGFIDKAISNKYGIRAAVYEFTYLPVLQKLQEAIVAGCDVQIVYDSRGEEEENNASITAAGLTRTITRNNKSINILTPRTKDPQVPSHNKFFILLDGDKPIEVWTGSTNITDKGIFGQSNVGHIIKSKDIAAKYLDYWTLLHDDPELNSFKTDVKKIQDDIITIEDFSEDVTVFFSPREKKSILKTYALFIDSAAEMVCGIFPFSFNKDIKNSLSKKTSHLKYILVDKIINAAGIIKQDDTTLIVNGAYFDKPMFDWMKEINSGILLNKTPNAAIGTNYVHNKILLIDPLGNDPVIIVGSANFSDPSVSSNDENTMVIKGGEDLQKIADIYFTEFYRVFQHFFIRKATEEINKGSDTSADSSTNPLHLKEDNSWINVFNKDTVKMKMQSQLTNMPLPV